VRRRSRRPASAWGMVRASVRPAEPGGARLVLPAGGDREGEQSRKPSRCSLSRKDEAVAHRAETTTDGDPGWAAHTRSVGTLMRGASTGPCVPGAPRESCAGARAFISARMPAARPVQVRLRGVPDTPDSSTLAGHPVVACGRRVARVEDQAGHCERRHAAHPADPADPPHREVPRSRLRVPTWGPRVPTRALQDALEGRRL
jgi:hypothetical protein